MREILTFKNGNIRTRVIGFDVNSPNGKDELFLSFSEGREHGPIIERTGNDSPRMRSPEGGGYTTDPELQRLGSWFITEEKKRRSIARNFAILAHFISRLGQQGISYLTALRSSDLDHFSKFLHKENLITLSDLLNKTAEKLNFDTAQKTLSSECTAKDWTNVFSFLWHLVVDISEEDNIKEGDIPSKFDLYQSSKLVHELLDTLKEPPEAGSLPKIDKEIKKLILRLFCSLKTKVHATHFHQSHKDVSLIALQGCGDLSMNGWNVAFINRKDRAPLFVFPFGEPVEDRTYTCLVKWTREALNNKEFVSWKGNNHQYEIDEVEINRYSDPPEIYLVRYSQGHDEGPRERGCNIAKLAEFAVYGQRIIHDRRCVNMQNAILQFSDLRHIFELPNLNPKESFIKILSTNQDRPRTIFSRQQDDDVWLGEYALLQDRNLQRAALAGPIQLDLANLGTTSDHIEAALEGTDRTKRTRYYEQVRDRLRPLDPGQWRKIEEGREIWYEIFFRRNVYPCSILGISETGELISYVWKGVYSDPDAMTIEGTAEELTGSKYKIREALLIDEGADVFQDIMGEDDENSSFGLSPGRSQFRAIFLFANRVSTSSVDSMPVRQSHDFKKPKKSGVSPRSSG